MRGRLERAASDPVYMRYRKAFLSARSTGGGPSQVTYPRVAVYTGTGASHSWIWFADLLERAGLFDVVFVGESGILGRALESADVLLVGGGDTYAIAESLGAAGAGAILSFVLEGRPLLRLLRRSLPRPRRCRSRALRSVQTRSGFHGKRHGGPSTAKVP